MARYGKMQQLMLRVLAVMLVAAFVLSAVASATVFAAPRKDYACGTLTLSGVCGSCGADKKRFEVFRCYCTPTGGKTCYFWYDYCLYC